MAITDDLADDTLAVVLAGGNGTRLDPLTRHICKPALPFGGGFRSIDFTLSNCANSGVRAVGVATQYKPAALLSHLAGAWNGAPGDGSIVVPWRAEEHAPATGYRGTADAVFRNLERIDAFDPRLVLVLAGDHVYKMDYRPMLEEHCARGADVTVGCVDVPVEDARHFGVLTVGDDGRIERFVEKPQSESQLPRTIGDAVPASMGIYVFSARRCGLADRWRCGGAAQGLGTADHGAGWDYRGFDRRPRVRGGRASTPLGAVPRRRNRTRCDDRR
jgi:glucose-1-phosphate adenylyltransferase